jgi:hypothetical protein
VNGLTTSMRSALAELMPINTGVQHPHGSSQPTSSVPFQTWVKRLPQHHLKAYDLENASVHLLFICALNLANQDGLRLSNGGQLGSLDIFHAAGGMGRAGKAVGGHGA